MRRSRRRRRRRALRERPGAAAKVVAPRDLDPVLEDRGDAVAVAPGRALEDARTHAVVHALGVAEVSVLGRGASGWLVGF